MGHPRLLGACWLLAATAGADEATGLLGLGSLNHPPAVAKSATVAQTASCAEAQYKRKVFAPTDPHAIAGFAYKCTDCQGGMYYQSGKPGCKKCSIGQYSVFPKSKKCLFCPHGKFNDLSGFVMCKTCPKGYYQNLQGYGFCYAYATQSPTPGPGEQAKKKHAFKIDKYGRDEARQSFK